MARPGKRSWPASPILALSKSCAKIPCAKRLLYAGTETGAFVSFDDGNQWGTLQLNLPTVSVRDMVVHGDDLVAATYGRAFWILDDLTPLRQINEKVAKSKVYLFQPATAIRLRNDMNQDTPLPPEMPAGDNPPTGAILDYYFETAPRQRTSRLRSTIRPASRFVSFPAYPSRCVKSRHRTCRTIGSIIRRRCPRMQV